MKISVIILTYNRSNYLLRAVNSVLSQTVQDFELLIVNNGSTDSTKQLCDRLVSRDKRIKVFHIPKSTIGAGRNVGIEHSTGDYITFIDDDDEVLEDYLELLLELACQNNAQVSICGVFRDEEALTELQYEQPILMSAVQSIITLMWRNVYSTGFPAKLIASNLLKQHRFSEVDQYEDIGLMYKVLADASTVVASKKAKYHVFRHTSNHSAATEKDHMITKEYIQAYRKHYRERTEWLCNRFAEYNEYWWYFDWSFQISMINKIISNNIVECDEELKEMRAEIVQNREAFLASKYILDYEKKWVKEYIR